jgi:hypothetical protein
VRRDRHDWRDRLQKIIGRSPGFPASGLMRFRSDRTAVFPIENAKQKFGMATLQQVVAQAVTHDIICI